MSEHTAKVIRIESIEQHPNADRLGVVRVFDGYTCVVSLTDWKVGDLAVYVEPDTTLPNKPEYEWLGGHLRIRAKKLRGVVSYGLLVPAPEGAKEGDDLFEQLELVHYEPQMLVDGVMVAVPRDGQVEVNPSITGPKYDIENYLKYGKKHIPFGSQVIITEKIHGMNARYTFQDDKMWASSREYYRIEHPGNPYWKTLKDNPWIEELCRSMPNAVIYGEIFGWVASLKYGVKSNVEPYKFRLFDIFDGGKFKPLHQKFMDHYLELDRMVPILYVGELTQEVLDKYTSGQSTIKGANHIREGCVIRPYDAENQMTIESWNEHFGRVILKSVSPSYLEKY